MTLLPPEPLREFFREFEFPKLEVRDDKLSVLKACLLLTDTGECDNVLAMSHEQRVEKLVNMGFERA